ncbi:MAG: hypothetical protein II998_13025 [Clostridia bacterium]|nr:hypothetical protein [Clostridia bacterium]
MKKLLALMMAVLMIAGIMTVPAFAAGEYLYDEDKTSSDLYVQASGTWLALYSDSESADIIATEDISSSSDSNHNIGNSYKAMVYKILLPTIPEGKVIDYAEFRMSSYFMAKYVPYLYGIPSKVNMTTLTVGEMRKYVSYNTLGSGENFIANVMKDNSAYQGDTSATGGIARNRFDVSDYIVKAIEGDEKYVYLAAVSTKTTVKAYNKNGRTGPKLYYTLKDAPALTVENSTIEDGATAVYPIGTVGVTFSNNIKSVTATINGVEVPQSDITISGNSVSVAFNLGLSAATELTVNATDPYSQTVSHTISFTTDSKYKFYDDSDMAGVDYILADDSWILTYDASATDTSVTAATDVVWNDTDVAGSGKNAVVYKVKLPELPEGKTIDTAEFRATSHYTVATPREMQYAYKMPGDDWNMATITIADAQKIIDGNNLGAGNNYIGLCTKDNSYVYNQEYRNKYSVSEYVAECIANDQEYMYIALTRPSSMVRAYAHDEALSRRKAKLFYTLKDVPVIKGAKVVSADSEAAYADATDIAPSVGDSIKAIAYMINNTETDVSLNVGVAQYKDGELVALSFVPYTLAAGTDASTIEFGATTVETDVDTIKAIIWDTSDNPVIKAKILEVK